MTLFYQNYKDTKEKLVLPSLLPGDDTQMTSCKQTDTHTYDTVFHQMDHQIIPLTLSIYTVQLTTSKSGRRRVTHAPSLIA